MSEGEFLRLLSMAGKTQDFSGGVRVPRSSTELERLLQEVRRRLGQTEFRSALVDAYNSECAVTGCDVVDALEAAHLIPFCESESNVASNGLLLRADIHTLFDRHLIGINPVTKVINGPAALGNLLRRT